MKSFLSITVLVVLGIATPVMAQDSSGRKELARADLSGAPGMEVILSVTELKPGDVITERGAMTSYASAGLRWI
jgi:hypothetical protein